MKFEPKLPRKTGVNKLQMESVKTKKPPKWWLISSYKNVLQVLSGGLFTDAEMRKDILENIIGSDGATENRREMV